MSSGDYYAYHAITTSGTAGTTWQQLSPSAQIYGPGGGNYINPVYPAQANQHRLSIRNLSEALKDDFTKNILLCKTKEECKEKFGSYGLELFESFLGEVLQEAIKSEENFTKALSQEREIIGNIRTYIKNNAEISVQDILKYLYTL